jgi:hypothetical protein
MEQPARHTDLPPSGAGAPAAKPQKTKRRYSITRNYRAERDACVKALKMLLEDR